MTSYPSGEKGSPGPIGTRRGAVMLPNCKLLSKAQVSAKSARDRRIGAAACPGAGRFICSLFGLVRSGDVRTLKPRSKGAAL